MNEPPDFETWRSPTDASYQRPFLRLPRITMPDTRAGVVIVSSASHVALVVAAVSNLRDELRALLEDLESADPVIYWMPHRDEKERESIVRNLTDKPQFVG